MERSNSIECWDPRISQLGKNWWIWLELASMCAAEGRGRECQTPLGTHHNRTESCELSEPGIKSIGQELVGIAGVDSGARVAEMWGRCSRRAADVAVSKQC